MRTLKPLVRLLQRSLSALLLRRAIAWIAWAAILILLGGVLVLPFGDARVIRLGLLMAALSALPAFLLWPPSERLLTDRLRRLDADTVFEAYLEADQGPAREILRGWAMERAAALPLLRPVREPVLAGLGGLLAAAIACLILVEGGSFLLRGRSFGLAAERPAIAQSGARIEERGFSDFATEDPVARLKRLLKRDGKAQDQGENATLGAPGQSDQSIAASRRTPHADADPLLSKTASATDSVMKRRHGEPEGESTQTCANAPPSPGGTPGEGSRNKSEPGANPESTGMIPSEKAAAARGGAPPSPGRTGQGYEHTADTKVPSPLLDYRSQFEARYAERTGRHISASGRMGFGELRAFQRRYFETFTLHAQVGAADDPYLTLLRRRWTIVKGGTW
jgi:hypothetical protein